jgi:hypothetical protein
VSQETVREAVSGGTLPLRGTDTRNTRVHDPGRLTESLGVDPGV